MSILQDLRAATQPAHQKLESHLGLPKTLEDHIARLLKFYRFHRAWESVIFPYVAHLDLENRRKLHLLEADLRHFGTDPAQLSECPQLPYVTDTAAALGSMYVLEGSTLGGQLIARHLESNLHLQNRLGYSYFLPYGSDTGKMWQSFKSILEAHATPQSIPTAIETFDAIDHWL